MLNDCAVGGQVTPEAATTLAQRERAAGMPTRHTVTDLEVSSVLAALSMPAAESDMQRKDCPYSDCFTG